MEPIAADLERWMEVAAEATEIAERRMKEDAKEAEVKAVSTKPAADYVSSAGTLSETTAVSNTNSTFARAPNYTSCVVGVAISSGYTLIIIML